MRQFLDGYFWIDGGFFSSQVINIRTCPLLRFARAYGFASDDPGDFGVRIMQIACNDGPFGTDNYAGWLDADLDAMSAIVALSGGMAIGVNVECVVWTCLHT